MGKYPQQKTDRDFEFLGLPQAGASGVPLLAGARQHLRRDAPAGGGTSGDLGGPRNPYIPHKY